MSDTPADISPSRVSLDAALGRPGGGISEDRLETLLGLRYGRDAATHLAGLISRPLADLVGRPGKRIRGRLVSLGARLAGADTAHPDLARLVESVEALHAGSLAVDDLQDGSAMRRGAPALHVKFGVPIAVNVGNLLYFWPPEAIAGLGLSPAAENRLHRLYHRTMVRAHLGQAMDIGVPVDTVPQERVTDLCLAAMELKSGALFAFSLLVGAVWAGADAGLEDAIDDFGHGFGIALQMFDDIGNVRGTAEPAKRREDLLLRRPTWIWACAARHFSREVYTDFVSAVHTLAASDPHPIETWFDQHDFLRRAGRLAHDHMDRCFRRFEERAGTPPSLNDLRVLAAEIARAYE